MEVYNTFLFYLRRFKDLKKRQMMLQVVSLGMLLSGALITYKVLMLASNSESPIVVVLSGSMEPAIHRGDLLVLTNYVERQPLTVGDIVVYKLPGRGIPIVHRIIKLHENATRAVDVLTKGDNNIPDDRELYGRDMKWLQRDMIVGRSCAFLPYAGMLTILMNDYPKLKVVLLAGLSGLALIGGE